MPVLDSPIAQVDGHDKSFRKNSSNQKNSKSAEKSKLVKNPVSKGFRIPKKIVKEKTTTATQNNINVQKISEEASVDNIMKNLVKLQDVAESTADAQ